VREEVGEEELRRGVVFWRTRDDFRGQNGRTEGFGKVKDTDVLRSVCGSCPSMDGATGPRQGGSMNGSE
jgi:hypothetical protein